MKIIITESQLKYLRESPNNSELSPNERFKIVADKVIQFMDFHNLKTIPRYRFLQDVKCTEAVGVTMKYILGKFVREGEYDGQVKPLIQKMRPEFTRSTELVVGANNYLVDDGVAVKSMGEVIVYNTFKMNDLLLSYEDPSKSFYYFKETPSGKKLAQKRPDFYLKKRNLYIEVAGLNDQERFGKDYTSKLLAAKEEIEKTGAEMIILDYLKYKSNPQGFYKYVCDEFNFPYDEDNFWLSISYIGMDIEDYTDKVEKIINKGGKKTRGEQDMLNKIVTRYMTKPYVSPEGVHKRVGYKGVKEFKRDTGMGLKFGNKELRKLAQIAWCASSGSNVQTYHKFKGLFGDKHTLSKNTIENMKFKFPDEFDMTKRTEICGELD
jgi:hypothetical protein